MADPLALTFQEVWNSYIPDLYKFVVPIAHKDEHGKECLGSGVFVNLSGRSWTFPACCPATVTLLALCPPQEKLCTTI